MVLLQGGVCSVKTSRIHREREIGIFLLSLSFLLPHCITEIRDLLVNHSATEGFSSAQFGRSERVCPTQACSRSKTNQCYFNRLVFHSEPCLQHLTHFLTSLKPTAKGAYCENATSVQIKRDMEGNRHFKGEARLH